MQIRDLIKRFLPYLARVNRPALACLALVVLAPLIATALLWSFKLLIDEVLIAGSSELFVTFLTLYAVTAAAKIIVEYATQVLEANTVERIVLALRGDLYAHVLSLSPGSLGTQGSGDVLARLQGDTNRAEYLIFTGPLAVAADAAAVAVFAGFLTYLHWQMALIAFASLPVIMWVVQRYAAPVRKASLLSRKAESLWMSLAEERLAAVPVVHAFDALGSEARAFRRRCGKVRRMEVQALVLQARQSAFVEVAVAIAGLAVLSLGASLISSGQMTVGALVAFIGTAGSLYQPVRSLAKSAGRFQSSAAGAERVAALLDRPSLVKEAPDARRLGLVRGGIEFRNVHFGYGDGAADVLDGISLRVAPGECVALVGPSGSGKSSLLKLLLRQFDPAQGCVLIDGHDVRDIKFASLRAAVAPVFQDALVFNGSIEKNIRYGAPNARVVEVATASAAAAVAQFAAGRNGLATTVGTWGSRLSGGQRQRVALARALIREAPILVLDEATAGVDSETEDHIQAALDVMAGQRTILIVAHRLSSVRAASRVVVIENGRIVEEGRPLDLLARPSRCRALFAAQLAARGAAA